MEADFSLSCVNSSTNWVEISLSNSELKGLIDAEDLELVGKHTWRLSSNKYIKGNIAPRKPVYLHRFVMESHGYDLEGKHIDHANHKPLDNRKSNLRICSQIQNAGNTIINRKNNTSGYKGVCKILNKWRAVIYIDTVRRTIGTYATAEEAARAYDVEALAQWGEFALINNISDDLIPVKLKSAKSTGCRKMSKEQMVELVALSDTLSHAELADLFGITKGYVSKIIIRSKKR